MTIDLNGFFEDYLNHDYSYIHEAVLDIALNQEANKMELKPGEKYLTVYLFNKVVKLAAFPVKDRKENEPHFRGDGISVYINIKKAAKEEQPKHEDVL